LNQLKTELNNKKRMKEETMKNRSNTLLLTLVFGNLILILALYIRMGPENSYYYLIIINFIGFSILLIILNKVITKLKKKQNKRE